jgi:hypothetical protein
VHRVLNYFMAFYYVYMGVRGGAVGCGTVLQAGRSRVRFSRLSLEFFIDIILPVLGSTQSLAEMSTRNISFGVKAAGALGWQPHHLHVLTVLKSGSLNLLESSGPVQACSGMLYNCIIYTALYYILLYIIYTALYYIYCFILYILLCIIYTALYYIYCFILYILLYIIYTASYYIYCFTLYILLYIIYTALYYIYCFILYILLYVIYTALYYIYCFILYILLYIQPADGFEEPKHVAANYLKWQLIKAVIGLSQWVRTQFSI